MSERAVRLVGWMLALNSLALAAAVALSPSAEAGARTFLGWCGIA